MGNNTFLIILIIGMLFVSGCIQQQNTITSEKGFLEGKIVIGPLCPVERNPPDPACLATEETYKAWPVAVWTTDKRSKVAQIETDPEGSYRIELSAGDYVIDLEKQKRFGIGGNNLPATIKIRSGETTTFNINIDTGIR